MQAATPHAVQCATCYTARSVLPGTGALCTTCRHMATTTRRARLGMVVVPGGHVATVALGVALASIANRMRQAANPT